MKVNTGFVSTLFGRIFSDLVQDNTLNLRLEELFCNLILMTFLSMKSEVFNNEL